MKRGILAVVLICVMTFVFAGCASQSAPPAGYGQCTGPGCPVPDPLAGTPPTTMPQTPMSPIP